MRLHSLPYWLERLSFFLWIAFTIFTISITGVGLEGIIFNMLMGAASPIDFQIAMVVMGTVGTAISMIWRQVGIDHLHYSEHDDIVSFEDEESRAFILKGLIRKVEMSTGVDRTDARASAKTWLAENLASLDEEELQLARTHLGYLLPMERRSAPARAGMSRQI
jgi:hypothetical protein